MADETERMKNKLDQLKKTLERKEIEMQSIQHIGKALSSELRIEQLLQLIMDEVTRLMNAERSTFYIVDEERGELWSQIAQKAEILEIRLKIGTGIAGHVAKTGEIINISDAYNDDRFDPSTDKKTGYHTRSILCMPIFEPTTKKRTKPAIIGVLQVLNKIDGVFTDSDEDLLSSISSQVAISIINSRLYSALEKKINEVNLLYEIEREMNQAYNLEELLNKLVEKICEALKIEASLISLLDQNNEYFTLRAAQNINLENLKDFTFSKTEGLTGKVTKKAKAMVINNTTTETLFEAEFWNQLSLKINQLVLTPLIINKQVIGILMLFNKSEQDEFFREEDIRIIDSLASQISRSIEAYRLRDEKIQAERLASIGNMMSAIVHDIRTPMNNINGFVDLMQEENEMATREEYAEIVMTQIKTLTNMTTDILDFAKGKTNILPIKYPVNKIIDRFNKVFEHDVTSRGYQFETACNTQSMIYVDPEKIHRVFMNIMKNALEAMDKGGKFSLTADQENGEVVFKLSDTGQGIPAEIKDRLFDSFVTSGKEGGTGLGLAIVKELVDQHKGKIEVDSVPKKGTTFKIYLKKL
ncbi:MAG TPA: GAF domain-containing sensor histidine kinase [Caldithrix sp.]|nr:GAF domain-containing sensor histidine kinase [Caldithrix sp.]